MSDFRTLTRTQVADLSDSERRCRAEEDNLAPVCGVSQAWCKARRPLMELEVGGRIGRALYTGRRSRASQPGPSARFSRLREPPWASAI